MKLKLKMMAVAAALASLAGAAHADLTSGSTTNNGSFSLVAFNTVTRDWYIRDLGLLINDFLPSTITTAAGDGSVTGTRTPGAGLSLSFADATFSTWFSAQTASDVRWMVGAYDQLSSSGTASQRRAIVSSTNAAQGFLNSALDAYVQTAQYGGLSAYFNPGTLSKTGVGMQASADSGFQSALNLSTLGTVGSSSNLFYAVRSAFTGGSGNAATVTAFGNGAGLATLLLEADGDLIYTLAPESVGAVPLPAAAWMLGAGLIALGGAARRRRAEAAA